MSRRPRRLSAGYSLTCSSKEQTGRRIRLSAATPSKRVAAAWYGYRSSKATRPARSSSACGVSLLNRRLDLRDDTRREDHRVVVFSRVCFRLLEDFVAVL